MLAVYRRLGLIDLAMTVALGMLHAALAVSWALPGVASGVYAPTPGRVSVVSALDQYGPVWVGVFGVTALILFAVVARPQYVIVGHALGAGGMAIFAMALWFGYIASDPKPSIMVHLFATFALIWHILLIVTYRAALSLPVRAGGTHRGEA